MDTGEEAGAAAEPPPAVTSPLRGGGLLGYFEALAAAALWGSSGIFAVYLFRLGVPPETIALWRPALGALLLILVFALVRPGALRVPAAGLWILTLGGGVAVGIFQIAYQLSTAAVGVPTTVALLYLAPAFVIGASGPLLGEWPTRTRVVLAFVTITGVWLSVAGAEEAETHFGASGLGWGLLAALSYATYTLFGRFATPRYGAVPTVVYSTAGACVVLLALLPPLTGRPPLPASVEAWALLVLFAALTITVAQFLFFDALGRIQAGRASLTTAAEPVVASLLATLLLGQGLSPLGWVGVALVVAGVVGVGLTPGGTTPPPPRRRRGRS